MTKRVYTPQSLAEDHRIVMTDDERFSHTKKYIEKLVLTALSTFIGPEEEKNSAYRNLMEVIPLAARRFIDNGGASRDYKFSTYFGWYISEEFKKYNWKRRAGKTRSSS